MDGGEGNLPVFLHGMWRSGTTFVWSQFRKSPGAYCYYEPLHDALAKLTVARLRRNGGYDPEALGHNPLAAPYFNEFEPLLGLRGVKNYRRAFAFDRLVMHPEDEHEQLRRYVGGLITHAEGCGRTPVLGFNRSCLMVGWLAQRFRALNVYIVRSPEGVCASYLGQLRRGNPWFIAHWLWVLERNETEPLVQPLIERLPLRKRMERLLRPREGYYLDAARRMSAEQVYFMTVYLWLAGVLWGACRCDLVLDMDRLHEEPYRQSAGERLRLRSGLTIGFEDSRSMTREVPLDEAERGRIEGEVLAALPRHGPGLTLAPGAARGMLSQLTSGKAELLAEAV